MNTLYIFDKHFFYIFQTPGEAGTVRVRRGQMVDKGQVTEDIEVTMSASHNRMSAPGSPGSSEHHEAPGNESTSIGHCVLLHVTCTLGSLTFLSSLLKYIL